MKRALVLGGGGSKGAYEIGVWKALDELDMHFDIVTGTSIGALIGTLYVQRDYDKAYELWRHMKVDDVMINGVNLDKDIELIMSQKGRYVDFLASYMQHRGADITPFEQIIERLFDAERFYGSDIDFGCMTVNFTKRTPQPMLKKDMDERQVKDFILASASCFPAFPMKVIGHEKYIDGGYYDNVPIALAQSMGAEEIVAVDLKPVSKSNTHEKTQDVTYIQPYVSLGSFLLFDEDRILRNMQLGWQDTMKAFGRCLGTIYTFPCADKEDIEAFEVKMAKAFLQINEILGRENMKKLTQKVVDYKIKDVLEDYQVMTYPWFGMLERIAYDAQIDDLGIRIFSTFVHEVLQIADCHIMMLSSIDITTIKEVLLKLKDAPKLETICYIYQYLMKCDMSQSSNEIRMISLMAKDSFMKAYVLYAMKKEFMF